MSSNRTKELPVGRAIRVRLSGFVLPLGFFRSGRVELVVRATAKRWLRLCREGVEPSGSLRKVSGHIRPPFQAFA